MSKTTTCTYHCSACGCHFHSLEAFDAHRVGDFVSDDPETLRRCVHPLDLDGRLAVLADDGVCRMYAEPKTKVTVWTSERTRGSAPWDKASSGLGVKPLRPSQPSPHPSSAQRAA